MGRDQNLTRAAAKTGAHPEVNIRGDVDEEGRTGVSTDGFHLTRSQKERITELSHMSDVFDRLAKSIAPNVRRRR